MDFISSSLRNDTCADGCTRWSIGPMWEEHLVFAKGKEKRGANNAGEGLKG